MNVFYSLQQHRKAMERKTTLVVSGQYSPFGINGINNEEKDSTTM